MSIFNDVGEQIQSTINSTNLKIATGDARSESEAIKMRVRDKMTRLTAKDKEGSDYANLVKIHDQIEANHDNIYLRPEHGVSASQAKEDCEKILSDQKNLEVEFNLVFAKLTNDKVLLAEMQKLQRDGLEDKIKDTVEDVKDELKRPKSRP